MDLLAPGQPLRALDGLQPDAAHLGHDLAAAVRADAAAGPLRSVFGQFIGQVSPVECRTHCPHIWQPKTGFLTAASMTASGFIYAGTAARFFWIRSLARRTAVEASAA